MSLGHTEWSWGLWILFNGSAKKKEQKTIEYIIGKEQTNMEKFLTLKGRWELYFSYNFSAGLKFFSKLS